MTRGWNFADLLIGWLSVVDCWVLGRLNGQIEERLLRRVNGRDVSSKHLLLDVSEWEIHRDVWKETVRIDAVSLPTITYDKKRVLMTFPARVPSYLNYSFFVLKYFLPLQLLSEKNSGESHVSSDHSLRMTGLTLGNFGRLDYNENNSNSTLMSHSETKSVVALLSITCNRYKQACLKFLAASFQT